MNGNNLNKIREIFIDFATQFYERLNNYKLEELDGLEFPLTPPELQEICLPGDCSVEKYNEMELELKKQLTLLGILIQKKQCPISQIIDAI